MTHPTAISTAALLSSQVNVKCREQNLYGLFFGFCSKYSDSVFIIELELNIKMNIYS